MHSWSSVSVVHTQAYRSGTVGQSEPVGEMREGLLLSSASIYSWSVQQFYSYANERMTSSSHVWAVNTYFPWMMALSAAASTCCQHLCGVGQWLYLSVYNLQWPNGENPNCLMSPQHRLTSVFFSRFFPLFDSLLFSTHQSYSHLEPCSVDTQNISNRKHLLFAFIRTQPHHFDLLM